MSEPKLITMSEMEVDARYLDSMKKRFPDQNQCLEHRLFHTIRELVKAIDPAVEEFSWTGCGSKDREAILDDLMDRLEPLLTEIKDD